MKYYELLEGLKKIADNKEPTEKVKINVYSENPDRDLYTVSFLYMDEDGDIILS